ncbi:hypothetical protein [Butyrivibrio sp. MC2013]|uniref:hypothetical protein n=1 Tax=Butyrivibrio sp. MC2013 TaxID=1280686 RepID=UPI000404FC75|nr:hypothetical protein [Butyrivibrio sp. MC2013]
MPANRRRRSSGYEDGHGLIVEYEHEDVSLEHPVNRDLRRSVYKDEIAGRLNYYEQTAHPKKMPKDGVMKEYGDIYDDLSRQLDMVRHTSSSSAINQLKRKPVSSLSSTTQNRSYGQSYDKGSAPGRTHYKDRDYEISYKIHKDLERTGSSHRRSAASIREDLDRSYSEWGHDFSELNEEYTRKRKRKRGKKLSSFLFVMAGMIMALGIIFVIYMIGSNRMPDYFKGSFEETRSMLPSAEDPYARLTSDIYK